MIAVAVSQFSGVIFPLLANRFSSFFYEMKAKIYIFHIMIRTCKSNLKCRRPEAKLNVDNLKIATVC